MLKKGYRPTGIKDVVYAVAILSIYIAIIAYVSVLLLPIYWFVWLAFIVGGTTTLIKWHNYNFGYKCAKCGNEFEISFVTNFISANGFGKKYVTCPKCHNWSWASVLKIVRN